MEYKNQFIISQKQVKEKNFVFLELNEGLVLSYHKDLHIYFNRQAKSLLIGFAYQTKPGRKSPIEEIDFLEISRKTAREDIFDMISTWGGRFVYISNNVVYTDACALMSVFYRAKTISNNLGLLAEVSGLMPDPYKPVKGNIMNYMPGPKTQYPGIKRLLPSQIYDMNTMELSFHPLYARDAEMLEGTDKIIGEFIKCSDFALNNLKAMFPGYQFLVPLSGGYDSRTVFALAKHAGINIGSFTMEHDRMQQDDVSIPKQICRKSGTDHVFIERIRENYKRNLAKEYESFTSGLMRDEDAKFFSYGQHQRVTDRFGKCVLLRGSVWGNLTEYFRKIFKDGEPAVFFYDWLGVLDDSMERRSLDSYFQWTYEHPDEKVDAVNRFMWEQREACWLSVIETGYDIVDDTISFQPLNSRYLISMLLNIPESDRKVKRHEKVITERTYPIVSSIPYATDKLYKDSVFRRVFEKISRIIKRISKIGIKRTYRLYKGMYGK